MTALRVGVTIAPVPNWHFTEQLDGPAADRLVDELVRSLPEADESLVGIAVNDAFTQFRTAGSTADGAWVLNTVNRAGNPIVAGGRVTVLAEEGGVQDPAGDGDSGDLPVGVLSRQQVALDGSTFAVIDLVSGPDEGALIFQRVVAERRTGRFAVRVVVSTSYFDRDWDIARSCLALLNAIQVHEVHEVVGS